MIVIKNARLFTMDTMNDELGYLVIRDGKITEVGKDFKETDYKDYEIIDAKERIVTPGLVDPHCHIGVMEEGIQFEGNDTNEVSNPIYPELRGLDSVYPQDSAFKYAAKSGVTSVVTGPGS